MNKFIAAIDPGASGGMAWVWPSGEVETCSMENREDFIKALHEYNADNPFEGDEEPIIYMEKVTGFYPKSKVPLPGKAEFDLQTSSFSMFNFGKSAGRMLGICEAFGILPVEVMPAQWQKCCFTSKKGKSRQAWKNELKSIAQKRYPQIKVTLANADALLILSYATLITRGSIETAP